MRYEGNFRRFGELDITALRACVDQQTESAWRENDFRQKAYAVHRHTQTISLLFDDDFRHFAATRRPKYTEFSAALRPLIEKISGYFDYQGWMVRCILTRLIAGGTISPHVDLGFSLIHAHRFHLPVVTNEAVKFTVGEETVHMRAGEIWEINNSKQHSVINGGTEDRVHLILDWAEPVTVEELHEYRKDRQEHTRRTQAGVQPKYD